MIPLQAADCKILLVDDVRENINVLVQALREDYKLGVALNGRSALEYARAQFPDLILLDIMMPEMDGFEVSRRLKSDPATRDIPFIFITAVDEAADKTRGFEQGAVDYITKPFDITEVRARVRTHLDLLIARRTLAFQNEQMKYSLSLAMEVQQNLIPQTDPVLEGFDITGRIRYCDETGGDYFDYIDMPPIGTNHRLGIAVGDVSDHGIPSALLMTTARAALRQRAALPGDLDTIVQDLNRLFTNDVKESGRFMTLFFCCLDSDPKQIQWVRAGHDPALIFTPDTDRFETLGGPGPALGLSEDTRFESQIRPLAKDQVMVIYTDGIVEASRTPGEFFGRARLESVIRAHGHESASRIRDAIFHAVDTFIRSASVHDDLSVVVVKVC